MNTLEVNIYPRLAYKPVFRIAMPPQYIKVITKEKYTKLRFHAMALKEFESFLEEYELKVGHESFLNNQEWIIPSEYIVKVKEQEDLVVIEVGTYELKGFEHQTLEVDDSIPWEPNYTLSIIVGESSTTVNTNYSKQCK